MGQEYPKREQYFAHRFCRLLLKCCVANEHGQDVAMLLVAVAMTEDSKRYTGPVTFWNEQLVPLIGAANVKALQRARGRAVESGWLHYDAGARGRPAMYWVTIPDGVECLSDAPMGCEEEELRTDSKSISTRNTSSIDELRTDSRAETTRNLSSIEDSRAISTRNMSSVCPQSVHNVSNILTLPLPNPNTEARAPEKTKPIRNVIPPPVEALTAYCEDRGCRVDPQEFFDFYESKGWFVGKSKMRDWQAAVRTWEGRRESEQRNNSRHSDRPTEAQFDELYRDRTAEFSQPLFQEEAT